MNSALRTTDLVVLLVYMAGVFGLGCWFARKSGRPQEFMAAGRSLPGWAVGLSIFGTYVSSIGFLGNTGKAYGGTWNSWVFGLSLPIAAFIAVRWFIPLYRSGDEVSAYYHLEKRFGPWARTYALLCYLLSQLARIGTILYLVALALSPLTGWDIKTIILVTGVLVTVYTLLGGIEAVIWTDVAQSFVLIAGAILCAALIITDMPEGPDQLFQIANDNGKFSLGSFSLSPKSLTFAEPTFWVVLLYGVFINVQNFGIDQSFVQRYITARTDRDAVFSVWLATLLFPLISAVFFFIGTGLFSYYQTNPEMLQEVATEVATTGLTRDGLEVTDEAVAARAATLTAAEVGDKVLPHFIVRKLPIGLAGLLIAAIFAAAMSSMDTSLNSAATLYLCDVHKRYLNPDAGDAESMKILHRATLIMGVAGTLTALAMLRVRSALDAWWNLQGIFTGGMLGLFLLGLISRRARNPQAVVAVVFGVLLILWMSLSTTDLWPQSLEAWANQLHSFMTIVLGTSSIVLVGVLLSRFGGSAPQADDQSA
ncbi:MAG: sodium:solute symporter [Fuerstiella sp.]